MRVREGIGQARVELGRRRQGEWGQGRARPDAGQGQGEAMLGCGKVGHGISRDTASTLRPRSSSKQEWV